MAQQWTTANIPDQTGKIAIVTGANSGIGYETALALAEKGATVIMACRNLHKANIAKKNIQKVVPTANLDIIQLDLAKQSSVHQFVAEFKQKYDQLDLLINNAGVMAPPYQVTDDGFELQLAANHLGHFTLTGLVLDLLAHTPQSRVVNVSSNAHKFGKINFEDINSSEAYARWSAYGQSKLANILFTVELNKQFSKYGLDIIATAAHPGWTATNLQNGISRFMNRFFAQDTPMGALPTLFAATEPSTQANDYIGPSGFMEMRGYPTRVEPTQAAQDEAIADRLWQVSEALTGTSYDWQPTKSTQQAELNLAS